MEVSDGKGKARVLIVDDDPLIVKVTSVILTTNGYDVLKALGGEEGIEIARTEHPDVVLLDIMMPNIGGYEVLERLRSDPATKDIPIIFVSAKADADSVAHGLSMGAEGYITKPFKHNELLSKIDEVTK